MCVWGYVCWSRLYFNFVFSFMSSGRCKKKYSSICPLKIIYKLFWFWLVGFVVFFLTLKFAYRKEMEAISSPIEVRKISVCVREWGGLVVSRRLHRVSPFWSTEWISLYVPGIHGLMLCTDVLTWVSPMCTWIWKGCWEQTWFPVLSCCKLACVLASRSLFCFSVRPRMVVTEAWCVFPGIVG